MGLLGQIDKTQPREGQTYTYQHNGVIPHARGELYRVLRRQRERAEPFTIPGADGILPQTRPRVEGVIHGVHGHELHEDPASNGLL